jgi:uncharacterized membrane protein YhaH (DUF805 family)
MIMGPVQAIKTCLAKSFQFSGRASRAEFWWFAPLWLMVSLALTLGIGASVNPDYLHYLPFHENLAAFLMLCVAGIPLWSVTVRRLHDTGRTGRSLALVPIPFLALEAAFFVLGVVARTPLSKSALFDFVGALIFLFGFGAAGIITIVLLAILLTECAAGSDATSTNYGPNPNEVSP